MTPGPGSRRITLQDGVSHGTNDSDQRSSTYRTEEPQRKSEDARRQLSEAVQRLPRQHRSRRRGWSRRQREHEIADPLVQRCRAQRADGISMAQTAEGALGQVHDVLGRMRELAMQSSNGSLSSTDRGYLDTEFGSLKAEIGRIQDSAKFNGQKLVAVATASITFQVGLNNTGSDQVKVDFGNVSLTTLLATASSVSSATAALAALGNIDTSIQSVSNSRAKFGTAMNRLEIATSNIQTMRLNLSAANSRIVDVDVASETAAMSRNQVLSQAGVSVLAQANQLPQLAAGLLR